MIKKEWTSAELDILALNYPTTNKAGLIALLPGRTAESIHAKVVLLKLRKQKTQWRRNVADINAL